MPQGTPSPQLVANPTPAQRSRIVAAVLIRHPNLHGVILPRNPVRHGLLLLGVLADNDHLADLFTRLADQPAAMLNQLGLLGPMVECTTVENLRMFGVSVQPGGELGFYTVPRPLQGDFVHFIESTHR